MPRKRRSNLRSFYFLDLLVLAKRCVRSQTVQSVSIICLVAFGVMGCQKSSAGGGLNPGDAAPAIEGISLAGEKVSLADYKGKVTLLNFWASWCAPCVAELPALEQTYLKLKDKGFVIVGVAIDDDPAAVKELQQKYALSYPIIVDQDGLSKRPYEIQGVPETFLLDSGHHFLLATDPEEQVPVVRFVGPRTWDSKASFKMLSAALEP